MKSCHEPIPEVLDLFPRVRERLHSAASSLSGGEQKQLEVGRAPFLLLVVAREKSGTEAPVTLDLKHIAALDASESGPAGAFGERTGTW